MNFPGAKESGHSRQRRARAVRAEERARDSAPLVTVALQREAVIAALEDMTVPPADWLSGVLAPGRQARSAADAQAIAGVEFVRRADARHRAWRADCKWRHARVAHALTAAAGLVALGPAMADRSAAIGTGTHLLGWIYSYREIEEGPSATRQWLIETVVKQNLVTRARLTEILMAALGHPPRRRRAENAADVTAADVTELMRLRQTPAALHQPTQRLIASRAALLAQLELFVGVPVSVWSSDALPRTRTGGRRLRSQKKSEKKSTGTPPHADGPK